MSCSDTCLGCGDQKSTYAQLCPWCLKNWDIKTDTFKMNEVITRVLSLAKLKPEYVDILLAHESEYEKAFTAKSYDMEENYEIYELLGDGIANSFLSWYFIRRFPNLDCADGLKILARLKINYASKRSFSEIAESFGFWEYIRASDEQKLTYKSSLLEDVFEAFIGVTVSILDNEFMVGVGYGIAYAILEAIFNRLNISLEYEDLYDPKTRLKEVFDSARGAFGNLVYEDQARSSSVFRVQNGKKIFMGEGRELPQKIDRQQEAARQALKLFATEEGFRKRIHDQVLVNCGEIVGKRKKKI